jgi:hypothetical protein
MVSPIYLHVELRMKPKELPRFLDVMQVVAPLIVESGWTLVGAWRVRVGVAHTLRIIWSLPDANAFFNDRPSLLAHPRFGEFRSVIDAAVIEETVSIMTAVAYGQEA